MKKTSLTVLLCSLAFIGLSQKKIKYETVFFEDKTVESTNARINVENAVCEDELIKAKVKITNYTDKTIVIKPEECFYTSPKGNLFSHDKWMVIAPRQQESKVIDVKGDGVKTDSTSFNLNGFYICNKVETIEAKPMPLPPEQEISIGNFRLTFDTWDRDGTEITIKYKVKYAGDKIGMFVPSKVTLKSAEGTICKNQKDKDKTFSFKKNEDFLVGFLYISDSKKDNTILWNDAFSESTPEKAENIKADLTIDIVKTKDKN